MDSVNLISRWLHIVAAVAVLGGVFFMVLVLLPVLKSRPPAEAEDLAAGIGTRFKRVVHAAIGLLLLTGFYNYLVVAAPNAKTAGIAGTYHMVMGSKILLSLALFLIASLLLAPVQSMQAKRAQWLTTNAVLGLAILALAAYLRRLWP